MSLPGWSKYTFEKSEPLNISEIIPRLNLHGIDLLQVIYVFNLENASARSIKTNLRLGGAET